MRVAGILVLIFGLIGTLSAQDPDHDYSAYVYTESDAAFHSNNRESRTRFLPSVSTFGSGGIAYYTLPSISASSWQIGTGMFAFSSVPDRYYRGPVANETALALPLYTGIRHDFYRTSERTLAFALFGSLIGGPVIGMNIPEGTGFSNSFGTMQVRWGAGGQAALGAELFFSDRWAGYVQVGVDAIGFTRNLGDRSSYFGPAIGLGFGRVIGR